MKRLALTLALTVLSFYSAFPQSKVTSGKLQGDWKLIIDIDEAFDEAKKELDEDEEILGSLLLSSVSGLVDGLLENIDIYFEFQKNGNAIVTIEAFGDTDTETTTWMIDEKGRLFLDYDDDSFSVEENSHWILKKDLLINIGEDNEPNNIYLVKIQ